MRFFIQNKGTSGAGPTGNNSLIFILLLGYFCLGLFNIVNHEMWRDELQPWQVVKECDSISDIFGHLKYLGHPALWYVTLFPLTQLTDQPFVMQLYHLVLAAGAVFIFLRFSGFTLMQKTLFIFGYFPLYEYATISRNYIHGVLFIFLFCVLLRNRPRNYVALALTLFLLTQTSIYGIILAVIFAGGLLYEPFTDKDIMKSMSERKAGIITGLAILLAGIASSYLQIRPGSESGFTSGFYLHLDIPKALQTAGILWKSYVPIPEFRRMFWDTNILTSPFLQALLSIPLFCFSLLLFIRRPVVLYFYCFGTASLLMFSYLRYYGWLRNHGHLFILFITCLWISHFFTERELKSKFFAGISGFVQRHKNLFVTSLLIAQLTAGLTASAFDWVYPFSESGETARFIKDRKLDNMLILGDIDYAVSPVTAYLGRKIYYPRTGRFGTFVIWDKKWLATYEQKNADDFFVKAEQISNERKEDLLVVLSYNPGINTPSFYRIKTFNNAIVPDENYYLYIWKYRK